MKNLKLTEEKFIIQNQDVDLFLETVNDVLDVILMPNLIERDFHTIVIFSDITEEQAETIHSIELDN